MASSRSLHLLIWLLVATPLSWFGAMAVGVQKVMEETVIAGVTITPPPLPEATGSCEAYNFFGKRSNNASTSIVPSCSFGACGTTCLDQGSFCCNPGGSRAIEPQWICDNGACITSVRGALGVVDCYDPDNPSGTIQSCIDNVPTATCQPTDRCYTCSTDVPFCHWQTYVDPASPTLRWFSCVATSTPDETFYATSVTNHLLSTGKASNGTSSSSLSAGEIGGIAAAAAGALIISVAIVAWCCVRKRKNNEKSQRQDGQAEYSMSMVSPPQQGPPVIYYQEQFHELPDDDPQKQAYSGKGGFPMEASSTPVAELPAGGHAGSPPQGHQLYDDHGFLADQDSISPPAPYRGYSPQDTLVHSPSTPGTVSSPGRRRSDNRSPAQMSQGYAPTSFSPAASPHPQNQEYYPPPQEPGRSTGPPGHYAPNSSAYGRWGTGS